MFLNTDHSGLSKFTGPDDENFALLRPEIERMVSRGPSIATERHLRNGTDWPQVTLCLRSIRWTNYLSLDTTSNPDEVTGNVHWGVFRTVNTLFTGRTELLERLKEALLCDRASHTEEQKRFIITGLGGQGKSEICLKIANQMRQQ